MVDELTTETEARLPGWGAAVTELHSANDNETAANAFLNITRELGG